MIDSRLTTRALTLLGGIGLAFGAAAQSSSPAELRGYERCMAELEATRPAGLVTPRVYYIAKQGDRSTYYVNASVWQNGQRADKRVSCETTANGRQVLAFSAADGRFAISDGSPLNVAKR